VVATVNVLKSLWASVEGDPVVMRKLHGWLTIIWFVLAFPIMYFLAESVAFLVFVSVYAVVTGHWSSWQASRVEVKQDEETPLSPRVLAQIEGAVVHALSQGCCRGAAHVS
jgi:hypothetical protein